MHCWWIWLLYFTHWQETVLDQLQGQKPDEWLGLALSWSMQNRYSDKSEVILHKFLTKKIILRTCVLKLLQPYILSAWKWLKSADESLCESLNFINSRTVDLSIKGALCVYLRRIFKYNILKQIYRLYKTAGSHINWTMFLILVWCSLPYITNWTNIPFIIPNVMLLQQDIPCWHNKNDTYLMMKTQW